MKYERHEALCPFWEGDVSTNETLWFVGDDVCAPLLYMPDEVLAVRSSDLLTVYERGKDYEVENGEIVLLPGTAIPRFPKERYYLKEKVEGGCFEAKPEIANYLYFAEGDTIHKMQIAVTYRHSDRYTGFVPQKNDAFDRFRAKLEAGGNVKILLFGDSISTGCNASGFYGCPPYTEPWFDAVIGTLRERYPHTGIDFINNSVGGMETNWAVEQMQTRAIDVSPDLMIFAFGMNDGLTFGKPKDAFLANVEKIVDAFTKACPDADVALTSTTLPNREFRDFYGFQDTYEDGMLRLCEGREHIGVIPMTSVHRGLLARKRFRDMTGNNVNHPNDFLSRVYAQVTLKSLIG